MRPTRYELIGDNLVVVWEDGHESYYDAEPLRRNCPCAYCAGEMDLLGRVSKGIAPRFTQRSFEFGGAEASGNYGLQIRFGDGHAYGIWGWDQLRLACPCGQCGKAGG